MNFQKFPLDSQKCTILIGSISQQVNNRQGFST
jgi:hypothetical protein